jgi:hypothetical protein
MRQAKVDTHQQGGGNVNRIAVQKRV